MNYLDFNLKPQFSTKPIKFNDITFNLSTYIPVTDKLDLVMISVQKSMMDGICNPVLLDMNLLLSIVYLYTDIEFSDEDKADEMELYDALETNGLIDVIMANFDKDEYEDILNYVEVVAEKQEEYSHSAAAMVREFIENMPANAKAAAKIVEEFDPEKFSEVVNFARAANGGRDLNTNQDPV